MMVALGTSAKELKPTRWQSTSFRTLDLIAIARLYTLSWKLSVIS